MRHGQSTANARGVWQGRLDFPLSDLGRQQARKTGLALAAGEVSAVYASPLSRASETAEIIAREIPGSPGPVSIPGLVERHGGWFEGRTREEMAAEKPEFVEKLRSLPEEDRWPLVGAETDEEVLARFEAAVSDISGRHGDEPEARVVVVSHGGALRAFLEEPLRAGGLAGGRADAERLDLPPHTGAGRRPEARGTGQQRASALDRAATCKPWLPWYQADEAVLLSGDGEVLGPFQVAFGVERVPNEVHRPAALERSDGQVLLLSRPVEPPQGKVFPLPLDLPEVGHRQYLHLAVDDRVRR